MEKIELGLIHYAYFRSHQGLGGTTPAEIYFGRTPSHFSAIPPPRNSHCHPTTSGNSNCTPTALDISGRQRAPSHSISAPRVRHAAVWTRYGQVVTPKSAPTAAVTAIASAPQKVTRRAPAAMGAPPALAAIEPRAARKTSDTPATYGIRCFSGTRATAATGTAAPSANVMADVKAAWRGLAFKCRGAMGIAGGVWGVELKPFCLFLVSAEAF